MEERAQVLEEALRVQELTRELFKRKRKKKRKKKLPRTSSHSSSGRARRRQRQWHARIAGFPGDVTPRAVFPSVVVRPEMLGIMAAMDQKYFPRVWCAHRRLWQWHVQGWFCWCCSSRCVPFYCRQARVAGLHARSCNDRFPGPDSKVVQFLDKFLSTTGAGVGPDIVLLLDKIVGMPVVGPHGPHSAMWWPRSLTSAVACSQLVLLYRCNLCYVPFDCGRPCLSASWSVWTWARSSPFRQWHSHCWYAVYGAFALCSLRFSASPWSFHRCSSWARLLSFRQVPWPRQCKLSGSSTVCCCSSKVVDIPVFAQWLIPMVLFRKP